jgi:glycosyltransferase involved in cell wall biosynthesis
MTKIQDNLPKILHSVLVVTYNQESYIREAMESLFQGECLPYEVIVADDASSDRTVEILKEYKSRYPRVVKLILRKKNLGIFENVNDLSTYPTGNVISWMAGDDFFSRNLLHEMTREIHKQGFNPLIDSFMILPLVKLLLVNGALKCLPNNAVKKYSNKYSAVNLAVRHELITQNVGMSIALFKKWGGHTNRSKEIGLLTDFIHYVRFASHCKVLLLMEDSGEYAVHRVGSGVTSRAHAISGWESYNRAARVIIEDPEIKLTKDDLNFLEFKRLENNIYIEKRISALISFLRKSPKLILSEKIARKKMLMAYFYLIKNSLTFLIKAIKS